MIDAITPKRIRVAVKDILQNITGIPNLLHGECHQALPLIVEKFLMKPESKQEELNAGARPEDSQ
jgi:hypothetical protein